MNPIQERGKYGESVALHYFLEKGYSLIQQNYRSRWGEIDLILKSSERPATLVFVEVKYRQSTRYGAAIESVSRAKQRKIIRTAQDYLLKHEHEGPCRFDIIGLQTENLCHIENAFECE